MIIVGGVFLNAPILLALFFFLIFSNPSPSFSLVSLAEFVITPDLMCYFAQCNYGPKVVDSLFMQQGIKFTD